MVENLLHTILLNQLVIMSGILAPADNLVRNQIIEQIKHTRGVTDILDQCAAQGLKG